jgi:enoyl-CoA hydratase/carnithine racemase
VPPLSLDDLSKALVDPEPGAGLVSPLGGGAVVVDLTDDAELAPGAAKRLRAIAGVLIAVGSEQHPSAPAFDVVAPDAASAESLAAAVAAHPQAATALALLLRSAERLDVAGGLVAESATYSTLQAGPEHRAWLASRPPPGPRPDAGNVVDRRRDGHWLRLTLNRPHVRNAFDAATREALLDGLALAAVDPSITRVVIDGAGLAFCSGGDLTEFGMAADPASAHLLRVARSVGKTVHDLHNRISFVVHGACVGAGVELPAFASVVVARPDATFTLPEITMGLIPGAGGTVSLPRRIGRQRTCWLGLTGASIDASTALAWGLVDLVSDGPINEEDFE